MFDWIPTIDEIFDFWDCRIMGHKWVAKEYGGEVCSVCRKER